MKIDRCKLRFGLVIIIIVSFGGFGIYTLIESKQRANDIKIDIKERCKPVYSTLSSSSVTTIYTCPDDSQYEFTERI